MAWFYVWALACESIRAVLRTNWNQKHSHIACEFLVQNVPSWHMPLCNLFRLQYGNLTLQNEWIAISGVPIEFNFQFRSVSISYRSPFDAGKEILCGASIWIVNILIGYFISKEKKMKWKFEQDIELQRKSTQFFTWKESFFSPRNLIFFFIFTYLRIRSANIWYWNFLHSKNGLTFGK